MSSAGVVVDHLLGADAAGKSGHGMTRIPWLEGLLAGSSIQRDVRSESSNATGSSDGTDGVRSGT